MKKRSRLPAAIASLLIGAHAGLAQNFTPTPAPSQNWLAIASSADGTRLAAVGSYGWLYVSTNSGAAWLPANTVTNGPEPSRPWAGIACSADGARLAAVANFNPVFISTNFGATWTAHGPAVTWNAVASSADGAKLVAVDYNMGRIYTSTDSGNT